MLNICWCISQSTTIANLSPIHSGPGPIPCGKCPLRHDWVNYSHSFSMCSHFSESMVLAPLSPPSLELVHSLGDPLLSRSSVCSSFRPVSYLSAHCSHLWGSSHLGSTRILVPRTALPAQSSPYDQKLKCKCHVDMDITHATVPYARSLSPATALRALYPNPTCSSPESYCISSLISGK
ncbi:hypothetical protein HPP92_001285, partial [Vanilla planifolia]